MTALSTLPDTRRLSAPFSGFAEVSMLGACLSLNSPGNLQAKQLGHL